MGIQGLLRNLHPLLVPPPTYHSNSQHQSAASSNSNQRQQHQQNQQPQRNNSSIKHNILQFANKSLAIDASSWLHKAAYTCAERLVESTEQGTRDSQAEASYCKYMISRCTELLEWAHIDTIYLVFDGIRVPLKSGTNAERESKRQANIKEARRLMSLGRRQEAGEKYRSCAKANETMARVVAAEVEKKWGKDGVRVRVKCVWSPYEADSQLAKLCVDGWAHAVVTEDSDVLVYSAVTRKPFPIIYKLDRKDGSCDVVTMDWLVNPRFINGGSGTKSRRRRRRERERDLDYIYSDSPLEDEEEKSSENNEEQNEGEREVHPCEVEYDDLGYAPVRRTLPSPTSSNGKSKRRGSSGGSDNASGNAMLSHLRSFANKEASNPGAGVRLFVQACVLSGCDYVANRLSKVGPVTAFKLVKEASHRDAAIRFERVLNSNQLAKKKTEDEDVDEDEEDYDDFLSQPDTARNAKEKYEELLSKSEAVFYYHLAKELDTGNIVPLVALKSTEDNDREEEGSSSAEVDESSRPCIGRFESGLTFVGSAAEALKNKPEPLPMLATSGGQGRYSHRAPQMPHHNNNGWMSTNKYKNSGDTVQNSHLKSTKNNNNQQHRQPQKNTVAELPRETPLQRYLKGAGQRTRASGNIKAMHGKDIETVGSNAGKSKETIQLGGSSTQVGRKSSHFFKSSSSAAASSAKSSLHKSSTTLPATNNAPSSRTGPNPFAAFNRPTGGSTDEAAESERSKRRKSPIPTTSDHNATDRTMMKSPMFSPVKFDYGGYTPPPQGNNGGQNTKTKSCVDANTTSNADIATGKDEASPRPSDDESVELLDDHDDDNEREDQLMQPSSTANVQDDNTAMFDYGIIVPESPPIKAPEEAGILSVYIHQTKSCDSDSGPRRVSTSPPQRMKSNYNELMQSQNNGPEDVIIDLSDDADDDDIVLAGTASSSTAVNQNRPNFNNQTTTNNGKHIPNVKSSVNKRPFKSPYYPNTSSKKKTNSSALLAGFARQQEIGTKRKSKFFPTKSSSQPSQTKKSNSSATASKKRPKGTPSLKDFYGY